MELNEIEEKKNVDVIQEENFPSPTVEDTCTVYVHRGDIKMENTEIKGKHEFYKIVLKSSIIMTPNDKQRCFIMIKLK